MPIELQLRDVKDDDFATFFELLRDAPSARMAAFGTQPTSAGDLAARWGRSRVEGVTTQKAVVCDGEVVGFAATFLLEGELHVTYWIARSCWGRGVASEALKQLLKLATRRPIYASAAKDNVGSLRVLEKNGFRVRGSAKAFASGRGEDVDEVFLELR